MKNSKVVKSDLFYPEVSMAKPIPDYVPSAIRNDIYEACKIERLSPKASATLIRRALQGMLRNFHNVKPGRLVDEIDQISDKVDPLTWDTITAVRKVGNIGAHMEKDVNQIIDIEPGEAKLLIELAYTLIDEWYVARHAREERMKKIIKISDEKA